MAVVLLVDDERPILTLVSSLLRTSGHEALTASNGLEGLAVFRSYADQLDLVITDMRMPVMDGCARGRDRRTADDIVEWAQKRHSITADEVKRIVERALSAPSQRMRKA